MRYVITIPANEEPPAWVKVNGECVPLESPIITEDPADMTLAETDGGYPDLQTCSGEIPPDPSDVPDPSEPPEPTGRYALYLVCEGGKHLVNGGLENDTFYVDTEAPDHCEATVITKK